MEDIPLSAQLVALIVLLAVAGFFSLAETAMMAANRYRLRAKRQAGQRGAKMALELLAKTNKLLGIILLFNTLTNAAAATLAGLITVRMFGEEKWALGAGTLVITFLILVFSEITPKVIGATYPDRLAAGVSYVLAPLLRLFNPVVAFVNLFVTAMLKLLRLKTGAGHEAQQLSPEELRALVLEGSHFIPHQHQTMLLNLFDLERISVEDIMKPRGEIEAIDIGAPLEKIREQIGTSFHRRLPVYEDDPSNIVGILLQRRLLASALAGELTVENLREHLAEPYFIPAATPIYAQLQFFKENRQRFGLVVDEYGELEGLVTLEDIIEEIIGKFTTSVPGSSTELAWSDVDGEHSVLVDGGRSLRELNRALDLNFPLDGPKTLNGLILEHLQDIPESGLSVKIGGVPMEIVQTQDRRIRMVRVFQPPSQAG
ncbi:MAG TPA: CNNM domain-containing protein [Rhodocyclaceae bacterium]|nr:CNNM domain-containing protein [Rhodocyclaceae bacterium]